MPLPVPEGATVINPDKRTAPSVSASLPVPEGATVIGGAGGDTRDASAAPKKKGWGLWGVEQGIGLGLNLAGEAAGGALGLVGGPVGAFESASAGGALGQTGSDILDQYIDHYFLGTPVDWNTRSLIKDYAYNYATQWGTGKVLKALPWIVKKVAPHLPKASLSEGIKDVEELGRQAGVGREEQAALAAPGQARAEEQATQEAFSGPAATKAREEAIAREGKSLVGPDTPTPEVGTRASAVSAGQPELEGHLVSTPTERAYAHQHELQSVYTDVRHDGMQAWKKKYNYLLNPLDAKAVVTNAAEHQILQEGAYRTSRVNPKIFNLDTQKLLATGKDMFKMPMNEGEQDLAFGAGKVRYDTGTPGGEQLTQLEDGSWVPSANVKTTAGKLIQYMRYAGRVAHAAGRAGDDASAQAASNIEKSVRLSLLDSGIPENKLRDLDFLDRDYRGFKQTYDHPTTQAIMGAKTAKEASDNLFTNTLLLERAGRDSNAAQRRVLHRHLTDWAAENPDRLLKLSDVDAERFVQAARTFVPNDSIFANAKSLMFVRDEINNLNPEIAPNAFKEMTDAADERIGQIKLKAQITSRDIGIKELKNWGTIGKKVIREVNAVKGANLQEQTLAQKNIIDKFFSQMKDPAFVRQQLHTAAEEQKFWQAPVTDQIRYASGRVAKETPPGTWVTHMIAREGAAPAYGATTALVLAMTGHFPPFYGMMFGAASGYTAYRAYQRNILRALTSEFKEPVMSALAHHNYGRLGTLLANAAERDITKSTAATLAANARHNKFGQPAAGQPDDPAAYLGSESPKPKWVQSPDLKVGPMVKDLERKQATNMTTDRGREDSGHIDKIQELNKQVSAGKTPNIQHDLATGRLSGSEVRKILDQGGPASPADLFKGMTLSDAIDAFARGTSDEKAVTLTALAQKIQNEGQNMPPAQRRAMMVQLQRAIGQDQGEPPDQMQQQPPPQPQQPPPNPLMAQQQPQLGQQLGQMNA